MGLFTTRQLLGYTEQKVKFNPLFLSLFFRRTVTFPTQEVMLDKITGKTPIAAYVSPVVEGRFCVTAAGKRAYCVRGMSNRSMKLTMRRLLSVCRVKTRPGLTIRPTVVCAF